MAPNAEETCGAIAHYLQHHLQIPVEFVHQIPWQEREQRLDAGEIQIGWICGLPYVWKADEPVANLELLVAPVMRGDRYQNRPVYFSDVVVRQDSPYQSFADLRGTVWAYNEPRSHSGYWLTRSHLATLGETSGYFARVVESGAHQNSLRLLLEGQIDASAIDSTVLETELRQQPTLAEQIRIIDTLGPSPIPPWVIARSLPLDLKQRVRSLFLQMHQDPQGEQMLAAGAIAHFVAVSDADYDPIRQMAERAERVQW